MRVLVEEGRKANLAEVIMAKAIAIGLSTKKAWLGAS
jgi:hypothetical protein